MRILCALKFLLANFKMSINGMCDASVSNCSFCIRPLAMHFHVIYIKVYGIRIFQCVITQMLIEEDINYEGHEGCKGSEKTEGEEGGRS